ncbi:leucine-rich repeat and immunoglobulin-like domain-containing nogo receptor-interacting protein 3 [Branchiostoma lanceolatum]|uniref:leucine-rich repeat and immunoglobulin-like domain-containing nogo receptor-interacting protein 3 n=1 Tax=Branchiostoma lanceolatum TaxID=7740 RepID=UPI0034517F1F
MGVVGSLRVLFVIIVCKAASTGGEALPTDCICPQRSRFSSLEVKCTNRGLTTVPENIPPETVLLHLYHNRIRSVTYLPPLLKLYTLDLSNNLIESVSWGSFCNLPNLRLLEFKSNRITSVRLGTCIARTQLTSVDLSYNRITSLSERDFGVPRIKAMVLLHQNTFRCDCNLRWLITKLKCLQNLWLTGTYFNNAENFYPQPKQRRQEHDEEYQTI